MNIIAEQNGGNGSISLRDIHNKFKGLVIPAGLALYDTHSNHSDCYDIIHRNEQVHDSLYDRLLELASYDSTEKMKSKEKKHYEEEKRETENVKTENVKTENVKTENVKTENVKLKISPVIAQVQTQIQTQVQKQHKMTKKNGRKQKNNDIKQKQTRRRK
jgi:hypothetical protein